MSTVSSAVRILQKEKDRLTKELQGIAAALAAFGKTYAKGTTRRKLSPEGREDRRCAKSAMGKTKGSEKEVLTRFHLRVGISRTGFYDRCLAFGIGP
jgi:hypothetical protein